MEWQDATKTIRILGDNASKANEKEKAMKCENCGGRIPSWDDDPNLDPICICQEDE